MSESTVPASENSLIKARCPSCGGIHSLPTGDAKARAEELLKRLDSEGRLDLHLPPSAADPRLRTDYLFGEARGQMFGILECADDAGNPVILKAFSGQYNGIWEIEGWVPPILDPAAFDAAVSRADPLIKSLGERIKNLPPGTRERRELSEKRKRLSRESMAEIHRLYTLNNFGGEKRSLFDLFHDKNGIPAGTGDCCAPKLLNHAALRSLKPLSLAEVYWGRENRSGSRISGRFYHPCEEKCGPLLGFMLCGADNDR